MSDVGGQAGLWLGEIFLLYFFYYIILNINLGASVITLFEFIVFTLRLLTIFCRQKKYRTDEPSNNINCNDLFICNSNLPLNQSKKLSANYNNHNIVNSSNNSNVDLENNSTNENKLTSNKKSMLNSIFYNKQQNKKSLFFFNNYKSNKQNTIFCVNKNMPKFKSSTNNL